MIYQSKIKVVGAGPTGTLTALGLSKLGVEVILVDTLSRDQIINKDRSYALTHSSRLVLEQIGLWNDILPHLHGFSKLEIMDIETSRNISFSSEDLRTLEYLKRDVGWVVDHSELMNILFKNVDLNSNIVTQFASISTNNELNIDYIIAADGTKSKSRKDWGINIVNHRYDQACLTAKVIIRGVKDSCAYEIFRSEGPLAILPLGENTFQIIWSAPYERCLRRSEYTSSRFLDSLAGVLPSGFEPDFLLDDAKVFPLHISIATSLWKGKGILVGESAHSFHPVGGQGLNICWRDIKILLDLFSTFNSSSKKPNLILSASYQFLRYGDLIASAFITDFLMRIFSNRFRVLIFIRHLAFNILDNSKFLRRKTLRIMTYGPMTIFNSMPK